MAKPDKCKFYRPDNDDLLDGINGAMSSIEDAMRCLRGIREFDGWFDALGNIYDEMQPEQEMYENIAAAEYEAERQALTAEYWRSVI